MSTPVASYINFKALRKGLSFEQVLKHYHVEVKKKEKGNRHVGFCPLPTHQGKRKSPSFSAKLDWGVWQCFGCKASGNVLDFAVRMEGLDPTDHQNLRQVALKLQEIFQVAGAASPRGAIPAAKPRPLEMPKALSSPARAPSAAEILVNPPLDFELKNLDFDHPYLPSRGFSREAIKHFGLGYCNRGLMAGRIVIPIHNVDSKLVGYAGRLVDDNQISEYHPKYKFPGPRERQGKLLEFKSSHLVYNVHRIRNPVDDLIIVEGFASVWWLTQHDYTNLVALMGCSCSDEQASIILSKVHSDGRVWIFSDGDPAGANCAESTFSHIAPHRWVKWVKLNKGQPTDCNADDLAQLLWKV